MRMLTRDEIYDEMCQLLTDFENQENVDDPNINWEGEFYTLLVKIQNRWEDTIVSEEE